MKHLIALLLALLVVQPAFATTTTVTSSGVSQTPVSIATTGVTGAVAVSTSNTMQVLNTQGDVFLIFGNADSTNVCTITITPAVSSINVRGYGPLATANVTVSTTHNTTWIAGPFPALAFNVGGYVQWTATGTGCPSTFVQAMYSRPL